MQRKSSSLRLGRQLAGWTLLLCLIVGFLFFGLIFLFRDLPIYLGYDIDTVLTGWQALQLSSALFCAIVILVYCASICWLYLSRLFLTREETEKIMTTRLVSRLDRWLLEKIHPRNQ